MVKTEEIIKKINTESLKTVHMTICECLFSPNKMMPKISHVHGLDYCFSYKTHSAYRLIHLSLFFFFFLKTELVISLSFDTFPVFPSLISFYFCFLSTNHSNEMSVNSKQNITLALPNSFFQLLILKCYL